MSFKKLLSTLTKLNLISLGAVHMINRFVDQSALENQKVLLARSGKYYTWKWGKVFYSVSGKGDRPLLLLHDASVESSSAEWEKLVSQISDTYRIYMLDLPGCGRSDKPAVTYTNYLYVQLLHSFILDVIGTNVTVVASALSSSFSVMAASFSGNNIHKIYAINPLSFGELSQTVTKVGECVRNMLSLPVIGSCIYHIAVSRRNIEFKFAEKMYYNPFHISKVSMEKSYIASHMQKSNGRFLLASLKGHYLNWDIRKALRSLDIPITIVIGDKLPNARKTALSYKKLNKQIEIRTLSHCKALPQLENPSALAAILKQDD